MSNKKVSIVVDFEADNLMPFATTIWVGVVKIVGMPEDDLKAFRVVRAKEDLLRILPHVDTVVNHNLIGYDLPLVRKVWDIPFTVGADGKDSWGGYPMRFVDTLHLSQFLNPDLVGGHSLESFGERVGSPKGSHSDWSCYSPEMEAYCKQDTITTERTYHWLMKQSEQHYE